MGDVGDSCTWPSASCCAWSALRSRAAGREDESTERRDGSVPSLSSCSIVSSAGSYSDGAEALEAVSSIVSWVLLTEREDRAMAKTVLDPPLRLDEGLEARKGGLGGARIVESPLVTRVSGVPLPSASSCSGRVSWSLVMSGRGDGGAELKNGE